MAADRRRGEKLDRDCATARAKQLRIHASRFLLLPDVPSRSFCADLAPSSADCGCPIVQNTMISAKVSNYISSHLMVQCAGMNSANAERCCVIIKNTMVSGNGLGTHCLASYNTN